MHPFDRLFYDEASGGYTVGRWLADLRERFGGVDAALLWPTYPMLGIDDRNAYDMIRSLPGGIDALRGVVRARAARVGRATPTPTPAPTLPLPLALALALALRPNQVRELHEEGVRVLWPLMPWDTVTLALALAPAPVLAPGLALALALAPALALALALALTLALTLALA